MNKNVKDWLIVLAVWIPLISIIVGSVLYLNGTFDGTFMKEFFPALFFGIGTGWLALLLTSNIFPSMRWAVVSAIVAFIVTIIIYLCVSTEAGMITFAVVGISAAVFAAIKRFFEWLLGL